MTECSTVIMLMKSSPEIVPLLIQLLKERTIEEFHIISTPVEYNFLKVYSDLLGHHSLHWLRFTSNSISDREVESLANIIKHNTTLTYLSLSENPYITTACVKFLADLIVTNRTLTYLSLRDTSIDDEGIQTLTKALIENKELKELKLSTKHKEKWKSHQRLSF